MSMLPLWTTQAMAAAMRAEINGALPQAITGISIDSRTVASGEAYFAIKGAVHDGHDFVASALKAGAALAVVEKAQRGKFAADAPLLVVDDVLAGLVELAHAARARLTGQVIAEILSATVTPPPESLRALGVTHWSSRRLADWLRRTRRITVSHDSITRLWRRFGLQVGLQDRLDPGQPPRVFRRSPIAARRKLRYGDGRV